MKIDKIVEPYFGENMYMLVDTETKKAAVIDPGGAVEKIVSYIKENSLELEYILLTHGHGDHIGGVNKLKKQTNAKVVAHKDEAQMLGDSKKNLSYSMHCGKQELEADIYVNDKEKLDIGTLRVTFIHTPGHTPGGMCIRVKDDMFTGDTLFAGSIGRTDLFGGDFNALNKSLKKLSKYEDNVKVHPGHGPSSTLGREKMTNPYM